ncbi:MAG: ribonuclease HII [Candidatus Saccharimonadales bacterium]
MNNIIVGIDEVGRGCWAGPLVAAAVILPSKPFWEDCPPKAPKGGATVLRDSKRLSKKQRERLDVQIRSQAVAYGVGWVTPDEVDAMGLTKSVQLAMLRAVKKLHQSGVSYDKIIIDGNINYFSHVQGLRTQNIAAVVRADDTYPAVSAASIVAKVARDNYMAEMAAQYPGYSFEKHVGYGTAAHIAALKEHGVTDMHRKSFAPVRAFAL